MEALFRLLRVLTQTTQGIPVQALIADAQLGGPNDRPYEKVNALCFLGLATGCSSEQCSTHVITITLGYSAGLLAAMLSCGYVLMRGLNLDGGNKDLRRSLTKAVYGCICLTVFLSLVGTVLGGIWANYSWGRFWGWDPKENGALMIVLWTLAILHARMGGIIKEWGLHLASLFTACIVAFSWWHVNFLGVGLHNYGFTAGKGAIWVFYGVMMLFILFGAVAMLVEHFEKQAKIAAKPKAVKGLEA